jgi:hypothetical protein
VTEKPTRSSAAIIPRGKKHHNGEENREEDTYGKGNVHEREGEARLVIALVVVHEEEAQRWQCTVLLLMHLLAAGGENTHSVYFCTARRALRNMVR